MDDQQTVGNALDGAIGIDVRVKSLPGVKSDSASAFEKIAARLDNISAEQY
jgi:hypothetical protein